MRSRSPELCIALDGSDRRWILDAARSLGGSAAWLKIGLEAFVAHGPRLVREVVELAPQVFLDLKLHDIPNTTAQAALAACELGVWMLNVHASAGPAVIREVRKRIGERKSPPLLIGVTVLTHLTPEELGAMGIPHAPKEWAVALAKMGKEAGLDGVVCSAHEVRAIKEACGSDFLTVVPGIRMPEGSADDQKRIATPAFAFGEGADYIVVGRPVTQTENPLKAFQALINS